MALLAALVQAVRAERCEQAEPLAAMVLHFPKHTHSISRNSLLQLLAALEEREEEEEAATVQQEEEAEGAVPVPAFFG